MNSQFRATSQLEDILKRHGYYLTKPRQLLFETLCNHASPLSINEISDILDQQVSRASVYRTLQTLEKLNIAKKVTIAFVDKYELSDRFGQHHHHLTCTKCGRVVTIKLGERLENTIQNFGHKHGFIVKSHEIELRGLCRYCC